MFPNFHIVFFLALEVLTIPIIDCQTGEPTITCNTFWEQFKMVDDGKLIDAKRQRFSFVRKPNISKALL